MKLEFKVVSKISEHPKSSAKLFSVLNRKGIKFAKGRDEFDETYLYAPLATVNFEFSDPNLLDAFCVGDIVSLELSVAEPVQRKIIKDVNSWS